MIVLGLHAGAGGAGAAVADAGGVRGVAWAGAGVRPAAQLLALAAQALRAAAVERARLQGVAVTVGPGPYAGVRAAVATGKALAWAGGLPLAAVGALEALACAAGPDPGQIWAAVDARRGRVYAAAFRWLDAEPVTVHPPAVLAAGEFRRVVAASPGATGSERDPAVRVVGIGLAEADVARWGGGVLACGPLPAAAVPAAVAWLGRRRLERGERVDPLTLVPSYVTLPVIGPPPAGAAR